MVVHNSIDILDELEQPIVLPCTKARLLYGIDPVIFTEDDMSSFYSWYRFRVKHDINLNESDFKDYDMYLKYWILSLGLLEYSAIFAGGPRGNGKSLLLAWLPYQVSRLFNKKIIFDKIPPDPTLYGQFHCIYDEDFVERMQDELNDFDKGEKRIFNDNNLAPDERKLKIEQHKEKVNQLVIYSAFFALDECDKWAEKASRTNLTKLISRILNRARHYYLCFAFSMIDPDRIDQLIYNKNTKTHEVSCGFDWYPQTLPNWCSYQISDVRSNGTGMMKQLHLNPADWVSLWDSHDIVGVSHSVDVYLGGKQKKKKEAK